MHRKVGVPITYMDIFIKVGGRPFLHEKGFFNVACIHLITELVLIDTESLDSGSLM